MTKQHTPQRLNDLDGSVLIDKEAHSGGA